MAKRGIYGCVPPLEARGAVLRVLSAGAARGDAVRRVFHGDDERVPVVGYRRGMEIFMDVVERFAGAGAG